MSHQEERDRVWQLHVTETSFAAEECLSQIYRALIDVRHLALCKQFRQAGHAIEDAQRLANDVVIALRLLRKDLEMDRMVADVDRLASLSPE